MVKSTLNKGALQQERKRLKLYERLLPSLDLKRRQLVAALAAEERQLARDQGARERFISDFAERVPMLANEDIDLTEMLRVKSVEIVNESVLGVSVPSLLNVVCAQESYSRLTKPHWVDVTMDRLRRLTELDFGIQVSTERIRCLRSALKRTTQRLNLFEKRLIPSSNNSIRQILIFLADAERAAVVRAKLSKAKERGILLERTEWK